MDNLMKYKVFGFSAIEMMVVVAIITILAMIAIPSSLNRIIKEQITAALPLTDFVKEPIAASWKLNKILPADNKETGLPDSDKIVNNFVSSVKVDNGVIQVTFGNKVHPRIMGKVLSLRPAVIEDAQIVPVTWVCGNAKAPSKMIVKGENKTNVPDEFLPAICR
jgi:type IV pilus assembly protein PilA